MIEPFFLIRDAYCEPKPKPLPPIMLAGAGEKLALRRVAQYADWGNFGGDPERFAHKLAVLRMHCEAVGRSYDEIVKTLLLLVAVANTEAGAEYIAHASSKPFRPRLITGTPEQVAAQLQQYAEQGVGYFLKYFVDFPDPAGPILFAEEVIPQLRNRI